MSAKDGKFRISQAMIDEVKVKRTKKADGDAPIKVSLLIPGTIDDVVKAQLIHAVGNTLVIDVEPSQLSLPMGEPAGAAAE